MADTTPITAHHACQKISAEALGTFVLVFFGVGTALVTRRRGDHHRPRLRPDRPRDGLRRRPRSPAVTSTRPSPSAPPERPARLVAGPVLRRRSAGRRDCSAAACCGASARASTASTRDGPLRTEQLRRRRPRLRWWAASCVEVVTTLVFLLVILAVTDERNEQPSAAPLAIGLSLSMIHFATISPDRHVGEPRALDRRRRLRRQRRDHPAVALHRGAAARGGHRRPPLPRVLRPRTASRWPARG